MDLHLDDRLLHGRILHGWGSVLDVRRYVLLSRRLSDPQLRALHAAGAESVGAESICVQPEIDAPPAPREGDFWLTDAVATARWLVDSDPHCEGLIVIGLREENGLALPEGNRIGDESMAELERLAAGGLKVELRPFPGQSPMPLPPGKDKP